MCVLKIVEERFSTHVSTMALVPKGNKPEYGLPDGIFQAQINMDPAFICPAEEKFLG